jgi:hypothetical protein
VYDEPSDDQTANHKKSANEDKGQKFRKPYLTLSFLVCDEICFAFYTKFDDGRVVALGPAAEAIFIGTGIDDDGKDEYDKD